VRFVTAVVGFVLSILPLIFFWIGVHTFTRPIERGLAFGMVILTGALFILSLALLFTPSVQRLQSLVLLLTIVAVTGIWLRA
jgi:hypothetical protein